MKRLTTLLFASLFCMVGFSQTFISEDFTSYIDSITPPTGWKNVDSSAAQMGQIWRFDNPQLLTLNSPITDPAAILDSDWYGFGNDQDAYLESPSFDASLASTVTLEFDHFFDALGTSYGLIEVYDGSKWVTVDSITTSPDPEHKILDISSEAAGTANAQIRFRYVGSYAWHWIIDNVEVFQPVPDDIKVVSVDSLENGCGLTANESITATITNVGSTTIMGGIALNYIINGGTPVTETVTNTLNPSDTVIYTFTTTADLSAVMTYNIEVISTLRSDANFVNDTARGTSIHKPSISTFPYFEDFETGPGAWTPGGLNSTWAHGFPAGTIINSAASGNNAWVTNLSGVYNNDEESFVIGPCFDFTNIASPQFKMNVWWNSEFSWDGAVLQSSIDGGQTWQKVGNFLDPNNWYTDDNINGLTALEPSEEGWTGRNATSDGSGTWVLAEHDLNGLGGESSVELRIAFGSDGSVQDEGFAFDDVLVQNAPANDVGVVAVSGPVTGCGLGTADSVRIMVANFGSTAVSSFSVGYSFNGGTAMTETFTQSINPGDTLEYTFQNSTVNVNAPGSYFFDVFTSLSGDGNFTNDSLINVEVRNTLKTFPYTVNFDNLTAGNTGSTFANDWTGETSGSGNFFWTANSGTTTSTATGPTADHTTGSTIYMYTEASSPAAPGDVATLTSPCIDLTTTNPSGITLEFWYHMYGTDIQTLYTEVDSLGTWVTVDSIVGQQQTANADPYLLKSITINQFASLSEIRLRFRTVRGGSFDGDVAIDDVRVYEPSNNDAGVIAIDAPNSGCGLSSADSVKVRIKNFGLAAISSFPVEYSINGATPVSGTFTGTIQPGDTADFTFNTTANLSAQGSYNILAYTNLNNDGDVTNDSAMRTVDSRPIASMPFSDDFESGTANAAFQFTTNPESKISVYPSAANSSLYGLGLEGNSATNYATPNATNVWTTNPEHFASAEFCLDLTTVTAAEISYDLQQGYNFNDFYTNFRITVNGNQVGPTHRPNGSTTPWLSFTENISSYTGSIVNVALESMVKYDTASPNYNWVDNLIVQLPPSDDAELFSINSPTNGCGLGSADSVRVSVVNGGSATISTIDIGYIFNGGTPVIETYSSTILPGDTLEYTFNATVNVSANANYTLEAFTSLANDSDLSNDTLFSSFDNIPVISTLPYNENFDSNNGGWIASGASSSWAHGTPAGTYISAAASGSSAWVTNLSGDYNNSEDSYLESPCLDFSSLTTDPVLSFSHIYTTESCCDEGWIEYSIDAGNTWTKLIDNGGALEWYNDLTNQWWDGQSSAGSSIWVTAEDTLVGLAGESSVKLRFAFSSDGSVTDEGFGIDDISIVDPLPVGIDNPLHKNTAFDVYPNPSNGLFNVSVNQNMNVQALEVRDIAGKLVHELSPERSSANYNLDLNHLPKGVYMLKVRGKTKTETTKLIIQ